MILREGRCKQRVATKVRVDDVGIRRERLSEWLSDGVIVWLFSVTGTIAEALVSLPSGW
jgi:hypothetical protein